MVNIKTAKNLGVVHTHTHTSLLENKIKNKLDIKKKHRLSMIC